MKGSYASQVNAARLLLSGLRNNGQALARRGLDAEFVGRYALQLDEVHRLDAEQECLKSLLAAKTAELNQGRARLAQSSAEVKKLVKLDFPRTGWKAFGITDSR